MVLRRGGRALRRVVYSRRVFQISDFIRVRRKVLSKIYFRSSFFKFIDVPLGVKLQEFSFYEGREAQKYDYLLWTRNFREKIWD